MGYRSDVAYTIHFRNRQTINEFIALVMVQGGDRLKALQECEIETVTNSEVLKVNFYIEDVKWYDSYKDVQTHTWLYKFAVERAPTDCAFNFICVGEEQGDIEQTTGGNTDEFDVHNEFYTYSRITVPFSTAYQPIGDSLRIIED